MSNPFFKRFHEFILAPSHSRTIGVVVILIIAAAVPLTVLVAQQQQETRQHASGSNFCTSSAGCNFAGLKALPASNCSPACTSGVCCGNITTPAPTHPPTPLPKCPYSCAPHAACLADGGTSIVSNCALSTICCKPANPCAHTINGVYVKGGYCPAPYAGKYLYNCLNGKTVSTTTCTSYGCQHNNNAVDTCKSAPVPTAPPTPLPKCPYSCAPHAACLADGGTSIVSNCALSTICCKPAPCTNGATKCVTGVVNNVFVTCNSSGTWGISTTCPIGSTCSTSTGKCTSYCSSANNKDCFYGCTPTTTGGTCKSAPTKYACNTSTSTHTCSTSTTGAYTTLASCNTACAYCKTACLKGCSVRSLTGGTCNIYCSTANSNLTTCPGGCTPTTTGGTCKSAPTPTPKPTVKPTPTPAPIPNCNASPQLSACVATTSNTCSTSNGTQTVKYTTYNGSTRCTPISKTQTCTVSNCNIAYVCTSGKCIAKATPTPTPTPKPSGSPLPTPTPAPGRTYLSFIIGMDAIGSTGDSANPTNLSSSNKNPINTRRNLDAQVFDSNNNQVIAQVGSINYNSTSGVFTGTVDLGTNFAKGNYIVKVKSDGHLRKLIPGIQNISSALHQPLQMSRVNLVTGDVDNNNVLNLGDYNILLSCMADPDITNIDNHALCNKNSNYIKLSDLEDNGVVNKFDYNLFLREYSVQSGD